MTAKIIIWDMALNSMEGLTPPQYDRFACPVAVYLLTVPTICRDTPHLERSPVILHFSRCCSRVLALAGSAAALMAGSGKRCR
jgi:hypothetical protein